MKAMIGKAHDGWASTGFVSLMENGSTVTANSAIELMRKLKALGVKEHELSFSGSNDGDHSLGSSQQAELRRAWQEQQQGATTVETWAITDGSGTEVTQLSIVHRIHGGERDGAITAIFTYRNPTPTEPRSKYTFSASWSLKKGGLAELFVRDFVLPTRLRRRGIGTLCWSLIYQTLATAMVVDVQLHGKLSSVDKTMHDPRDNPDFSHIDDLERIDNIKRRNEFWLRMLDPSDRNLECDAQGNGRFRGRFVDPVAHASYTPELQHSLI